MTASPGSLQRKRGPGHLLPQTISPEAVVQFNRPQSCNTKAMPSSGNTVFNTGWSTLAKKCVILYNLKYSVFVTDLLMQIFFKL